MGRVITVNASGLSVVWDEGGVLLGNQMVLIIANIDSKELGRKDQRVNCVITRDMPRTGGRLPTARICYSRQSLRRRVFSDYKRLLNEPIRIFES